MGQVVWYEFIESEKENLCTCLLEGVRTLDASGSRLYRASYNVDGRLVFYFIASFKNRVKGPSNESPLLYDGERWAAPSFKGITGNTYLNNAMNDEDLPDQKFFTVLSDQHKRRFRPLTVKDKTKLDEVVTDFLSDH